MTLNWRRALRGLWSLASSALIFGVVFFAVQAWRGSSLLPEGETAPPVTLLDLEGAEIPLESFRGKAVLLHFWGPWCSICRLEFGALNDLNDDLPPGTTIVAAAYNVGDLGEFKRFIQDKSLKYPIYIATAPVISAFKVESFPTSYYLDPDGRLVDSDVGYALGWRMRSRLAAAR